MGWMYFLYRGLLFMQPSGKETELRYYHLKTFFEQNHWSEASSWKCYLCSNDFHTYSIYSSFRYRDQELNAFNAPTTKYEK